MQLTVLEARRPSIDLAVRGALILLSAFGVWRAIRWLNDARSEFMIDVDVYRSAGSALLHGHDLYGPASSAHNLPYLYTPFGALSFSPLQLLGDAALHVAWTGLLLAALVVVVRESLAYATPSLSARYGALFTAAGVGAAFALEPIAQNFKFGQINLLVAALVLLDLRGRTWKLPQGTLIGLAAAIKLTPLLFAVYLLFTARRHVAFVAAATFVASVAIGFAIAFDSSWKYWTDVAYDTSRVGVAFVTNQSINGFFARLLGDPEAVTVLHKLLAFVIGAAVLWAAIRAARNGRRMLGDALCGLTALLMSPISWSHHWVWIIPVLAWLAFATDRPIWGRWVAAAGFLLFWVSPIQWVPRGDGHEYHYTFLEALQGNSYLLGALLLCTALCIPLLRSGREARR